MHKDFHYYGTYTAAKTAGFSDTDAVKIAHAAQYVDDSSSAKIKDKDTYYITDFVPAPTVQTNTEIFKNFTMNMLTEKLQNEIARVWPCFHFLPGNYVECIKKEHTGDKTNTAKEDSWTFDKKAENQFKLMCLPNNEIGKEMINDITYYHKTENHYLELLGIRMHSLADTWAHMYHSGISAWFINDAYDVKELNADLNPTGSIIIWLNDPFFDDNLGLHKYSCTAKSEFYNSFSYIGHGRMGHFPDYGFKRYEYRPCWSRIRIKKDNQADFLSAFKQMVKAMECVRGEKYFDNGLAQLPANVETEVKKVIAAVELDQTAAWKSAISALGHKSLPDYDEETWLKEYKTSKSKNSSYYKFNLGVVFQINLVKDVLRRNGIYMDEMPEANDTKVKIENAGKNNYFGKAKRSLTYDYPQPDASGVELSFINPAGSPKSGDIVEIRTHESAVSNDYPYLMAWETPALYYQAKEFGTNRSKWMLEIKGAAAGTPIIDGSQIWIKNIHYTGKPCIVQYNSSIPPKGDYYTTAAPGGGNEQLWKVKFTNTGKYFYIACKNSNHVLQVKNASKDDVADIEQVPLNYAEHQKFKLVPVPGEDGYFYIQALHSQKMLDIDLISMAQNTKLIQYKPNNRDNQKFKFINCGDGFCYIVPKHSGKPLKVSGGSIAAGAGIVQYYDNTNDSQKFIFEKEARSKVRIKNAHSQMYLTVKDNSKDDAAPLVQTVDLGSEVQSQLFAMVNAGETDLYSLQNFGSSLYLDVDNMSHENNTPLRQCRLNNRDNQKFYIIDCDGGYKRIISKHANKAVDVLGGSRENGASIVQYHQKTPECQKFKLVYAG